MKDTKNNESKPKPATTSTITVYNTTIVTTSTSTSAAKHSNAPKSNMISRICEKKKPFQRQHENKNHNKTTNGTARSGGYLRKFSAVLQIKPFDWSICINLKLKFQCFQAANFFLFFSPFFAFIFFKTKPHPWGLAIFVLPASYDFF